MERTNRTRRLWARGLAVGGAVVLAASLSGGAVVAQGEDLGIEPFAVEQDSVDLGYRLPSLNSIAAMLVAKDRGYWEQCGLTGGVNLIQTEEVLSQVAGGGLDTGLVETVDFGLAQINGLPINLIGGYRPYSRNVIAVPPGIEKPEDLEGKDVLLGGTPGTLDFDVRYGMLQDNGFDLDGVSPNYVSVEGGSDAWVALMEEGKLFMSPIFNRHYQRLADQDFTFLVDNQDFGSDHVAGNAEFVANNPEATAALLCGLVAGIQVWSDPANMEYILELGAAEGIEITDRITLAYNEDIKNYQPYDGGWPMDELQTLFDEIVTPEVADDVDMDALLALSPLHAAQAKLGLEANPVVEMME